MIRDPSNTQADLRQAMARICYPWVTSHLFRKDPRIPARRRGASASGTSPTSSDTPDTRPSTLDYYLGRRALTTADCAYALEPLVHSAGESMVR
jgi:hypothetical protein